MCSDDDCPSLSTSNSAPNPLGGGCGTCVGLVEAELCTDCRIDFESGELHLEIDSAARFYMNALMLIRTGEAGTMADELWSGSPFGTDLETFRSTRAPRLLELAVEPAPGFSDAATLVYRVHQSLSHEAKTLWIAQDFQ